MKMSFSHLRKLNAESIENIIGESDEKKTKKRINIIRPKKSINFNKPKKEMTPDEELAALFNQPGMAEDLPKNQYDIGDEHKSNPLGGIKTGITAYDLDFEQQAKDRKNPKEVTLDDLGEPIEIDLESIVNDKIKKGQKLTPEEKEILNKMIADLGEPIEFD